MKLLRKMTIINQECSIDIKNICLFDDFLHSSFNFSIETSFEFSVEIETDLFDKENKYSRHYNFFGFPDDIK